MPNYNDFDPLFRDMRETARQHPDWTFVVADQPPERLGWAAFPPSGRASDLLRTWTIGQADARRHIQAIADPELQEALRSGPTGREYAIGLILGTVERKLNVIHFTSLQALFKNMKLVADHHPDWVFMGADDPGLNKPHGPQLGWIAFPPEQSEGFQRAWTIGLSDVRMQAQKLNAHWQEALRTAQSRATTLIELVIGRPGDLRPKTPSASRYDILMQD